MECLAAAALWQSRQIGGVPVIVRIGAVVALAVVCAGCANETEAPRMNLGGLQSPVPSGDGAGVRKTMTDKILAAIALEMVTGRKPDPSRFAELN